jgi:hypothetical protein
MSHIDNEAITADIKALEVYALNNYDAGGHWVYETYGRGDYLSLLLAVDSLDDAKQYLKDYWELQQEQYEDISATAF